MKSRFTRIGSLILALCLLLALAVPAAAAAPAKSGMYHMEGLTPYNQTTPVQAVEAEIDGVTESCYPGAVRIVLPSMEAPAGKDCAVYILKDSSASMPMPGRRNIWFIDQRIVSPDGMTGEFNLYPKTLEAGSYAVWMVVNDGTGAKKLGSFDYYEASAPAEGKLVNAGRSLSLDEKVYVNPYVRIEGFADVDLTKDAGLLIWNHAVTEAEASYGTQNVEKIGLQQGSDKDGNVLYGQQTDGIAAKEYADELYYRFYVRSADGSYTYSALRQDSVRDYCEASIAAGSDSKDTAVQLLHFGAAAQKNFKYRTDDLANKNILADYPSKAWNDGLLTKLVPVPAATIAATGDVVLNGRSLSLDGSIRCNFYFAPQGFRAASAELLIWNGVEGTLGEDNVTTAVAMQPAGQSFGGQSQGIAARNYGKTIFVCAKLTDADGTAHYSDVIAFSPEAYAAAILERGTNAALMETVRQMVLYGEEARIYFGAAAN